MPLQARALIKKIKWHRLSPYLIIGGGTLGGQALTLATMKLWALLTGAQGVGQAGMLIGWATLIGTCAGFGLSTGIIRWGPERLSQEDRSSWNTLISSAWWLWRCIAPICILLLTIGSSLTWTHTTGTERLSSALSIGTMAFCQSAVFLLTAEVNARQAHKTLACLAPANAIGQLCGNIPIIHLLGNASIPVALSFGSALGLTLTWLVARRERDKQAVLKPAWHHSDGRKLLAFGVPWMLASLGGSGVQSLLIIIVGKQLGEHAAGNFRAGTTIAVQYLAVFMGVLSQVYAPQIAKIRQNPIQLNRLIRRQSLITVNLIGCASLVICIFVDFFLATLYSKDFSDAGKLTTIYLSGMPLRAMSWCLGYVALATAPGWLLLVGELITGSTWLIVAIVSLNTTHDLASTGYGFIAGFIIHLIIMTITTSRSARISPPKESLVCAILWSTAIFTYAHATGREQSLA